MPEQLIITGFHRSGTSLTAQYLLKSGLFVGDELMDATPDNPHGHFEDFEAHLFHERVLEENGLSWMVADDVEVSLSQEQVQWMRDFTGKRNREHALWGFKDPRTCFFLDAWKSVIPDARILVVFRNPCDCVASLHRRHARLLAEGAEPAEQHRKFFVEPDLALRLWIAYNRALLRAAEKYRGDMVFLNHSKLIGGFPLIRHLIEHAGLGLRPVPVESVFDPEATRRAGDPLPVHDGRWIGEALDIWSRLSRVEAETFALSRNETAEELAESAFRNDAELAALYCERDLLRSEVTRRDAENEELRGQLKRSGRRRRISKLAGRLFRGRPGTP